MSKQSLEDKTQYYLDLLRNKDIKDIFLKDPETTYQEVMDIILYHNKLYYIYANPSITDYEYDLLFDFLKNIESTYPDIVSPNSPTQRLVGQVQEYFTQAEHLAPLLSLDNSYSIEDIREKDRFIKRRLEIQDDQKILYSMEPKFDGSSVELIYKNWYLDKALTRWDGYIWEDITENVKVISTVPYYLENFKNIPKVSFRWEIIMPKSLFNELNKQRYEKKLSLFANPRNAATWTLRQLDPAVVASRKLICFVYDIVYIEKDKKDYLQALSEVTGLNKEDITQKDIVNLFQESWLNVFDDFFYQLEWIEKVAEICENKSIQQFLESQNIEFDWIVIKTANLSIREKIWSTSHHPRWAIAYKLPAKEITTRIKNVEFSISRSGAVNPIAILEPVNLSGVNISKATLHNFDFIFQKDIKINDYVWIKRSGEVIPYIISVVKNKRPSSHKDIYPPVNCPVCGAEIVQYKDDINYYCSNINCPAVIKEKLIHFASKEAMDIEGLWDKLINMLVDAGLLQDYADIYHLKDSENKVKLKSLPLMGEKRVSELINSIENSKNNYLNKLLTALWVRFIGKKTAKILQQEIYNNLEEEEIEKFDYQRLVEFLTNDNFLRNIHWIGEKIILSCEKNFGTKENIKLLEKLNNEWVRFNNFENLQKTKQTLLLEGITFSITWKFDTSREKIINILENYGAEFHDKPTKETQMLLLGENPGSKLQKAKNFWIEAKNLSTFLEEYPEISKGLISENKNKWLEQQSLF